MLFLLVVVFGRAVARFYVDYLWHDGLGRADVFWGVIRAKLTLFGFFFAIFAVLASVNLLVADRLSPSRFPANVHPYVERFHELFGHRLRLLRYAIAGVLAVMVALPTTSQWQSWLLFRNSRSFGLADEQFGADVGFYVFELPFLGFVLDWLFVAMVLVLMLTLLAHILNGGVVFAAPMPSVRPATKGHIAVLLAALAALKAADYWVSRYETTNERRGFVQGATYAVVNAQLPALMLLMLIALLTAGLYLATIRRASWRLPLIASGLWLVVLVAGGLVYPAMVQSLVVNPNQQAREAEYIRRNVEATREAMGINIDSVQVREESFDRLTVEDVQSDLEPLRNVRLLNPSEMLSRFRIDQGVEAGLSIEDLDVDRYEIDGKRQQVLISARELDLEGSPNQSWQGRHLINTRGCRLVMAPVGRVLESDRPDYQPVELVRPELYFSPSLSGYAVAGTEQSERACPGGETEEYVGTAGVQMSSFARRAAFALAFLDYNVLGSGAIDDDSQMLWVRNVRDRLAKLAPFLSYDGDPYPVVVEGRVLWVVDAYTTTSRYPYAQRIGGEVQLTNGSGLDRDSNYVRNSVKAVVDAYDGSVLFYVSDPDDPIIQAWQGAFGNLFTPADQMPAELREHLRYPEDLFRVQTDVYSKYQLDPEDFFEREGAWSVAQAPGINPRETSNTTAPTTPVDDQTPADLASESSTSRFIPYYTMFRNPSGEDFEFVLLRPFVPFSRADQRTELQAYMTASSDPETYGQLTAYVVNPLQDGPRTVSNQIDSEPSITQQVTLQTGGGNDVRFGDLQLVPVADGLLWVRPFYAAVRQSADGSSAAVTEYRFVIVSYNQRAVFGESLGEALGKLFPEFEGDLGDRVGVDEGEPEEGTEEPPPPEPPSTESTPAELLAQADQLLVEADLALEARDLGEYQAKIEEAGALIDQALELLTAAGGGLTTSPGAPRRPPTGTGHPGAPDSADPLQLLGQAGEVVPEGDLVARLLVGEPDLAVADPVEQARVMAVGRRPGVEGVDVVAKLGELVGELGGHRGDAHVERGELVRQFIHPWVRRGAAVVEFADPALELLRRRPVALHRVPQRRQLGLEALEVGCVHRRGSAKQSHAPANVLGAPASGRDPRRGAEPQDLAVLTPMSYVPVPAGSLWRTDNQYEPGCNLRTMRALRPAPRSSSHAITVPASSGPWRVRTVSVAPVVVMMWVLAAGTSKWYVSTSPPVARSASTWAPPTSSSTTPGPVAGYWLAMNSTSWRESDVFQPIENVPIVNASGTAYCMIDVGSNAVKFVVSASYTSKMLKSTSSFDHPCRA